jgi:3',5'-cyclic-AMP phosphodiesterase
MIIAQISDTHIALDAPDAKRRLADLECTIAGINKLDPGPDAIVQTGDIVHTGRLNEYEQAQAILTTARAPVYALCGNKDDRTNCARHSRLVGIWRQISPISNTRSMTIRCD